MVSFAILSVVPVPDLALARRHHQLDDLDDESVAKVLFHRRKQSSGGIESLRWDQCAIGAVSLIGQTPEQLTISRWTAGEHDETAMLQAVQTLAANRTHLLSWSTQQAVLPLLRSRAVMHGCTIPSLWSDGPAPAWTDLGDWWAADTQDRPDIDAIASAIGLPGLSPLTQDSAMEAWIKGDARAVEVLATLQALNLYLMALRLLLARGECDQKQIDHGYKKLSAWLEVQQDPSLQAFHRRWRGAD